MKMTAADIALTSYAAKRCARRTHNEYAGLPRPVVSAQAEVFIDAGREFERRIVAEIMQAFAQAGRAVAAVQLQDFLDAGTELLVLAEQSGAWEANVEATLRAMDARVPVIIGGRLPDTGSRRGAPDLLVALDDGYVPVDIKGHITFSPSRAKNPHRAGWVSVSRLRDPATRWAVRGGSNRGGHASDDCMQLSHYVRMLESLGRAPACADGPVWGGIIGTSNLSGLIDDERAVIWHDLAEGESGSYLAAYDAAFALRLEAANAARAGGEAVRPFRISECKSCGWFPTCAAAVGPDDASFAITTGLPSAEEWSAIYPSDRRLTLAELASFPVSSLPADKKWSQRIRRAQMTLDGVEFEPHGGPGGDTDPIPSADVEVDFDIEWDTDGRIYQWGVRVREHGDELTARYLPGLASFDELDDHSEASLADACLRALEGLVSAATATGRSVLIFHWSDPERSRPRHSTPAITCLVEEHGIDLRRWCESNLFTRGGYSLKVIAPACGFNWSVDDAGGLESQRQLRIARAGGPDAAAAAQWCIDYNSCDVAAQAAIRDEWARRYALGWNTVRGS